MSADTLRRAAALMRERAAAASATEAWDWRSEDGRPYWSEQTRSGLYIQSWHPAVALAVADWLDEAADRYLSAHIGSAYETTAALAVARAYLGDPA